VKLIVEADGGSRGNPGPAGYGAVVRDALTGGVLAEKAEALGVVSNNVAEYRGLLAGLAAAAEVAAGADVEVRLDSKLVVEQMSGRWRIKHPDLKPLAVDAQRLASRLGSVRYTWIARERNKHADRLANEAMDAAAQGRTWRPSDSSGDRSADTDDPPAGRAKRETRLGWSPPSSTPTTTLLLRHGETPYSTERRFAGIGDIPLTDDGVAQARAAGEALADRGVDVILASPLKRTRQSAQEVADVLGVPVRLDEGFREIDFGEWEGLTFAEVRERWPADLNAWLADPDVAPPGGESMTATARRVRTARDKLVVRYRKQTVLVVTHVTPIKLLVRLALEAPPSSVYRMHLDVASLTAVDWYADGPGVMRTFNDTGHLRQAR
jgi:ribonuclease H / adenosylcobalamin/alpha-ribazole phosphatase